MKRNGCDIYGYPVYEREERLFIIASADGSKSVRVIAKDAREAGEIFGDKGRNLDKGGQLMPLFKSAHEALRFAYNYNGTNVVTATLGIPPAPTGRGLGGLDGAGEAGNIKRIAEGISKQVTGWVWATYLPNRIPCHCGRRCCQGWEENVQWSNAVVEMAKLVFGSGRILITKQYFSEKAYRLPVHKIAQIESISERHVYYLMKTVVTFFRGTKKQRGVGQIYLDAVDQALRKQGIVGDEE